MVDKKNYFALIGKLAIALALLINLTFAVYTQSADDTTRGLKPKEYAQELHKQIVANRVKSKTIQQTDVKKPSSKETVKYKAVDGDDVNVANGVNVGFTIWHLRETKQNDEPEVVEQTRIAVRQKG